MAVSFACNNCDRILTHEEAATNDFRCPDCRADLDVLDDPQNRTVEEFRREAREAKKPRKP